MYLPDETASHTPAPAGLHRAVCCRFVDYGTQFSEYYGKSARKVLIAWELVDELKEVDGERVPHMITRYYSWSMHPKAGLRADLESWRGRPFTKENLSPDGKDRFDVRNLLGAACMLNVIHESGRDGGVEARVKSITPLPKGTAKPQPISEPVYLSLEPNEYDQHTFDNLPEKTREKIKRSPEWKQLNGQPVNGAHEPVGAVDDDLSDSIPF